MLNLELVYSTRSHDIFVEIHHLCDAGHRGLFISNVKLVKRTKITEWGWVSTSAGQFIVKSKVALCDPGLKICLLVWSQETKLAFYRS